MPRIRETTTFGDVAKAPAPKNPKSDPTPAVVEDFEPSTIKVPSKAATKPAKKKARRARVS